MLFLLTISDCHNTIKFNETLVVEEILRKREREKEKFYSWKKVMRNAKMHNVEKILKLWLQENLFIPYINTSVGLSHKTLILLDFTCLTSYEDRNRLATPRR